MIYVIGEILVDLTSEEDLKFAYHAGGAPYNVSAMINSLGGQVNFQGTVGNDLMGELLLKDVSKRGFNTRLIHVCPHKNTTLTFVYLDENKDRHFSFMRKQNTDVEVGKLSQKLVKQAKIIHFGSLLLTCEKGRKYLFNTIKELKKLGKTISFDVNYRSDLLSFKEAKKYYQELFPYIDIWKMSLEEVPLLSADSDIDKAIYSIKKPHQIVVITKGKDGSVIYLDKKVEVPSISIETIDSNGAGDGFMGGFLYYLDNHEEINYYEALKFANACGAYVATKKGAIDELPTISEIEKMLC